MHTKTAANQRRLFPLGSVFALLLSAPLGACMTQHALPPPVSAYDYHDRHAVVLAEAPQVLDLLPSFYNGKIDKQTEGRIREFVARYNEYGHGNVTLLTPVGGSAAKATAAEAPAVRHALSSAGLKGNILTGEYQATDERLAAPIRLSFEAVKAKVAHKCGEWPRDLASGASLSGWQNESYWNFGCAEQATLAAQIADPRDLLSPRGQTPSDIEMRMRGIDKLRNGDDPSTNWRLMGTAISKVGSGG
jgi:pilus assembly protein CpaD